MLSELFVWLAAVMSGSTSVTGFEITYEQHAQFPKLYHLDDYYNCLGPADGLYCLGTFHVRPLMEPNPVYELMKEYSLELSHFNRTLIHRGYCVSSRCPSLAHIRDTEQRFQLCAAHVVKHRNLRTMLTELSYCHTHAHQYSAKEGQIETPHLVFLYIVLGIVTLNLIGTTYDLMTVGENKNKMLTSWSLVRNWSHLVSPYQADDPRFVAKLPIEAGRVVMMQLVVFTHTGLVHEALYIANPKYIEDMAKHWVTTPLQNGTSAVQIFLILSSFMLANSMIEMNHLSLRTLPKLIIKRVIRIVPVYLLVIGFASTWWPLMLEGPQWHAVVTKESETCRNKFWYHAFFLHNLVDSMHHCQVQTWSVAVDMQLYILSCITMICLQPVRRVSLPLLGAMFTGSIFFISCLAYINHWKSTMFISGPENIRQMYLTEASFYNFHIHPLSSLPSMLMGLFISHLHHHLMQTGFKMVNHKWILTACYSCALLIPVWTSSGDLWRNFTSVEFTTLFVAAEKTIISILGGALILGAYSGGLKTTKIKTGVKSETTPIIGIVRSLLTWRVWYPLGRCSFSAMMIHWCVNKVLKAPALLPITSTALEMMTDTVLTTFFTYLSAIPLTVCVEMPITKLYTAVTS